MVSVRWAFRVMVQFVLLASAVAATAPPSTTTTLPGTAASFTVPAAFPTWVFPDYYVPPGPAVQPQPVIHDPVLNKTFPRNLTDPRAIPRHNEDAVLFPPARRNLTDAQADAVVARASANILAIVANSTRAASRCARCVAALQEGQTAARLAPERVPDAMVALCRQTNFTAGCRAQYAAGSFGATWTQVLAKADVAGLDGQLLCAKLGAFCPAPPRTDTYAPVFPRPRPAHATRPRASGRRVKVLHLSDLHLDPRYEVGSEANCTAGLCCRHDPSSSANRTAAPVQMPAPIFGSYLCDSPYYLALAALQSIGPLTGTSRDEPPAFSLYTGDLVAHDPQNQRSRDYVQNIEVSIWHMFKSYIGGPVYAALGNHDTNPDNLEAPHGIDGDGPLGRQFSWNHEHVSALWAHHGWIDAATAAEAATHYGAYSVVHPLGLRVITLNTDFYYRNNHFALLNASNPDFSGMFAFLIAELQKAEDAGQRAWIVGHVLPGWDGSNALPNGSDLLYQIVERYAPHVVAGLFFGHTHEDQAFVYYAGNGSRPAGAAALASAWVGPSLTPLTNLNAGYRLYEVDTGTWDVHEAYTFYADVDGFAGLDGGGGPPAGPVFALEYSTRAAYGAAAAWPADAPLNATFWHAVTEAMERDRALVALVNRHQGKSSARTPNCTSDACAGAKVCYMRSGSAPLGALCPQGFGSVQSPYTGVNF